MGKRFFLSLAPCRVAMYLKSGDLRPNINGKILRQNVTSHAKGFYQAVIYD